MYLGQPLVPNVKPQILGNLGPRWWQCHLPTSTGFALFGPLSCHQRGAKLDGKITGKAYQPPVGFKASKSPGKGHGQGSWSFRFRCSLDLYISYMYQQESWGEFIGSIVRISSFKTMVLMKTNGVILALKSGGRKAGWHMVSLYLPCAVGGGLRSRGWCSLTTASPRIQPKPIMNLVDPVTMIFPCLQGIPRVKSQPFDWQPGWFKLLENLPQGNSFDLSLNLT